MSAASSLEDLRVRYLHGRPGPHALHGRFAETVGGEFEFIDLRMRWQDQERSILYRVVSSFVCAATLPGRRDYDVFLIDNLHIAPVLMKLLFLRKNQKIVVHLGSHTLYFLHSHRFSRLVERIHLWALARYDALICEGRMAAELAQGLLGDECPPTYETFLGPPAERSQALAALQPDLGGRMILFISSGPGPSRMHYKGLDLMIDAFAIAAQRDTDLEFNILGDWDADVVEPCLARVSEDVRSRVHFRGRVDDVENWLERAALYLHCTRGDAFPTATVEAMTAGLVPIVSEWTGTRQIIEEVDAKLIAPMDPAGIAEKIGWYFALDGSERKRLATECRRLARGYTEETARAHYRETFTTVCRDLGLIQSQPGHST
jgi:glycosyltransferase involved in cell wall biosynthesis